MVDLDWKAKMVSSDIPNKSPKLSNKILQIPPPTFSSAGSGQSDIHTASSPACSAYEQYLRLPELRKLWDSKDFPDWNTESILKPSLHALEITFRFISTVLSDHRLYSNRREWTRRLESLAGAQIDLIAAVAEDDHGAPIADLSSGAGVISRDGSSAEVWRIPGGETAVVSRTSEASLLPRLATWRSSEDVAENIMYSIESAMRRCPYTLGLGEPNLAGKPSLEYDAVCRTTELHSLKKSPHDHIENYENQTVYSTHQVLECWVRSASEILRRIGDRIESKDFGSAARDCFVVEKIWKLLSEIEDLHMLMDPEDLLKLRKQLETNTMEDSEALCFRSRGLVRLAKQCKELRQRVPKIVGSEVDPRGGPGIQEAAMRLYAAEKEKDSNFEKVHLLQSFQAVESGLKRFFYGYKQVLVGTMGSLEAGGNRVAIVANSGDLLAQIFMEPTYFPSLDAAKTFLGNRL